MAFLRTRFFYSLVAASVFVFYTSLLPYPQTGYQSPRLVVRSSASLNTASVSCAQLFAFAEARFEPVLRALKPVVELPVKLGATELGPRFFIHSKPGTSIESLPPELIFYEHNVLHLKDDILDVQGRAAEKARFASPIYGDLVVDVPGLGKKLKEVNGVAELLLSAGSGVGAHFAILPEVESIGALEAFNRKKLNSRYHAVLVEGNDSFGPDVGILIDRSLPFDYEIRSFRNMSRPGNRQAALFSRDAPVILVRHMGADPNSPPLFAVVGGHLKSKRVSEFSKEGDDGSALRRMQAQGKVDIIRHLWTVFDREFPVFLMGDMNNELSAAPEFQPWRDAGFVDAFDLAPVARSVPSGMRGTHTYIASGAPVVQAQLDYVGLWATGAMMKSGLVLSAEILMFRGEHGENLPMAVNYRELNQQSSDHHPIVVTVDSLKLIGGGE